MMLFRDLQSQARLSAACELPISPQSHLRARAQAAGTKLHIGLAAVEYDGGAIACACVCSVCASVLLRAPMCPSVLSRALLRTHACARVCWWRG